VAAINEVFLVAVLVAVLVEVLDALLDVKCSAMAVSSCDVREG
jgi:hypothetical protein